MPINLDFGPDPVRAARMDLDMRLDLASSIEHLVDAAEGAVAFDAGQMRRLIGQLRAGTRYPPIAFATYFELADALIGEDPGRAEAAFRELGRLQPSTDRWRTTSLGEGPSAQHAARYLDLMCADTSLDLRFLPPAPARAQPFIERLDRAFALLDRAAPALSGEIRAIVEEIVVVSGDPGRKFQVDGGSHYQLWGTMFLNCDYHPNDVAAVEVMAHESAHVFLFGCCRDEMLVENDDEDLFTSPLRPDPRPMDGIYHATFVSARMHWAMSRLLEAGVLDADGEAVARRARDADAVNFNAGLDVVERHGMLTRTGIELMDGAKRYMAQAVA